MPGPERARGQRRPVVARGLILCLTLTILSSCFSTGPQQGQPPPAPSGGAISSVWDVPLPDGLAVFDGGQSEATIAIDDVTNEVYVLGSADNIGVRPSAILLAPFALLKLDRYSKTWNELVAFPAHQDVFLSGLAATNGWVFWTEWRRPSGSTPTRTYFAMKADGSERKVLAEVRLSADGGFTPHGLGFTAGGGTAMWFGGKEQKYPISVFDSSTVTTRQVIESSANPGAGQINGDRLLLPGSGTRGDVTVHSIQKGTSTTIAKESDQSVLGARMLFWTVKSDGGTDVFGCTFIPTATTACPTPTLLQHRDQGTAELAGVVGDYLVIDTPDGGREMISLDGQTKQSLVAGGSHYVACGGGTVVHPWYREGKSFIRVITTR